MWRSEKPSSCALPGSAHRVILGGSEPSGWSLGRESPGQSFHVHPKLTLHIAEETHWELIWASKGSRGFLLSQDC